MKSCIFLNKLILLNIRTNISFFVGLVMKCYFWGMVFSKQLRAFCKETEGLWLRGVEWENNLYIILDVLDVGVGVGGFAFRIIHKVSGHDLHCA